MSELDLAELTDDFGHWFAGFVDGEGCFLIAQASPDHYVTRFAIKLRADDRAILEEIQGRCGFGNITNAKPNYCDGYDRKPACDLRATSQKDCARVVAILRRYPLRAKKQRDFELWAEAVEETLKPTAVTDHRKLAYLARELHELKRWDTSEDRYRTEEAEYAIAPPRLFPNL